MRLPGLTLQKTNKSMTGSLNLRASAGANVHVSANAVTSDLGTTCSRSGNTLHFGRNTLFHAQEDVRTDGGTEAPSIRILPDERIYSIEIHDASVFVDRDAACFAEPLLVTASGTGGLFMDAAVRVVYA